MMLFLDGVERFVVVDMNLGVKVVVGDSGYRCSCVGGGSRKVRHVWGGRNECGFPKDKMNKSCFYKQEMKKKRKEKENSKLLFYYLLFFVRMSSSQYDLIPVDFIIVPIPLRWEFLH
jgi:hypothetical protein